MESKENRSTFFKRLTPFFEPSALMQIEIAYALAKIGHSAQVRKEKDDQGNPVRYFEHVRRVSLILIDEAQIINDKMIISSLLHDALEDTRDLTASMIEHIWGGDIVRIVKTLSKCPKNGYLERFSLSKDWRPYVIKCCDRLDNLRSLGSTKLDFRKRQVRETYDKYIPLFDIMLELTPSCYQANVNRLYNSLTKELHHQNSNL